mmetsp:Transcript_11475/g.42002  ORF Transcript_11475/g.42002 Transcript_11475/m.42002 type:complete len:545 (-) Transcript_11475:164-1798(-)
MLAGDSLADLVSSNFGDKFKKTNKSNGPMNRSVGGMRSSTPKPPVPVTQASPGSREAKSNGLGGFSVGSGISQPSTASVSPSVSASDLDDLYNLSSSGMARMASASDIASSGQGDAVDFFGGGPPAPTPVGAGSPARASAVDEFLGGASAAAQDHTSTTSSGLADSVDLLGMSSTPVTSPAKKSNGASPSGLEDLLGTSQPRSSSPSENVGSVDDLDVFSAAPTKPVLETRNPAQDNVQSSAPNAAASSKTSSTNASTDSLDIFSTSTAEKPTVTEDPLAELSMPGPTPVQVGNVDDLIDSFSNTTIQPTNKVEPSASFTNLEDLVVPVESKDGRSSSVEDILGWNAEGKPAPETEKKKHTFKEVAENLPTVRKVVVQAVNLEVDRLEGESDERYQLRKARLERVKRRELQSLEEKRQREADEEQEKNERSILEEMMGADFEEWAKKHKGNIRGLLSTMDQVLWEGAGWEGVSFGELMYDKGVKKYYRRAIVLIHPDKVAQRGADVHQKYVAGKIFDLLKEAWNKFQNEEMGKMEQSASGPVIF